MNQFQIKFRRNAVFTSALVLLLAAVIAFLSIAASALFTIHKQLHQVEDDYTIAAIPTKDGSFITDWSKTSADYDGHITEDRRGFLTAHVPGCVPLSPWELDDFSHRYADYFGRSLTVVAAQCTGTNLSEIPGDTRTDFLYSADFDVESVISAFPPYRDIIPQESWQKLQALNVPFLKDKQIPFAAGKNYLLFFFYTGPATALPPGDSGAKWTLLGPGFFDVCISGRLREEKNFISNSDDHESNGVFAWEFYDDGKERYRRLREDSLPFYAEYTGGSWEDFLAGEDGEIWRETILPMCRLNYESANVILTDNIDSIYMFNTGIAAILEGRKFEKKEYADGDAVCLISAAYAEKNGLSVGDMLHMDFYQSNLDYCVSGLDEDADSIMVAEPCREENRIGVQKDYTIAGIYTAPEFERGRLSFGANTIYIPKASIAGAEKYEDTYNKALYSVMIEPGAEEEFEQYAKAAKINGMFAYFDQGYGELVKSILSARTSARRLLATAAAAFVLTAGLALFLSLRSMASGARSMRLLGIKKKAVWLEMLQSFSGLVFLSAALGGALGVSLYRTVTARAISGGVAFRPMALVVCALVLAGILLAAAAICSLPVASQRLIRSAGRKKGKK